MDEDDSAMQQMMGFSAFSSGDKKRPSKKQKLNSSRSASSTNIHASAGNATPLGIRSTPQTTVTQQSMESANLPSLPQTELKQQDSSTIHTRHVTTTDHLSNSEENDSTKAAHNPAMIPDSDLTSISATAAASDPASSTVTQNTTSAKATIYTSSDIRSDPNYWTSTSNTGNTKRQAGSRTFNSTSNGTNVRHSHAKNRDTYPDNDEIGYTNSQSGYTLTNRELNEYARGRNELQEDGSVVKVYFKPNFLEDPWAEFN